MTISRARLESISLYNYIKYEVFGYSFIELVEGHPVTYNTATRLYVPDYSDMVPSPVSNGRGWVPFDEAAGSVDTSSEQTTRVSVPGVSTYTVNYFLGGIKTPSTPPSTVSYYWNLVSVISGWPGGDPPPLPLVAVDVLSSERSPLQLGPGHVTSRDSAIYVFATNASERLDIMETLLSALHNKATPIIDYSFGDYLNYDGTFNTGFLPAPVNGTSRLYFDRVSYRTVNVANDWSDLNKYRGVINFSITSYVE